MSKIKWLLSLSPKAKKYLILGIIFCIFNSLLSIATPLLIAKSIDNAVSNIHEHQDYSFLCEPIGLCELEPIRVPDYKPVSIYLIIALIIYLISSIIDYYQNLFMYRLSTNITYNLRRKVNAKIFKLPMITYNQSTNGEILSLVNNDIEAINTSLASDLSEAISSIILFIGIFITMLTISIKLSLTIIITLPICFILLALILSKGEKYFKSYQENLAAYNNFIEESYTGHNIITHHNATNAFLTKHQTINNQLKKSSVMSQFISSLMYPLTNLISNLTFVITCLLGSIYLIQSKITLGTLEAFITYAKNINDPLLNLTSLTSTLETINAASSRIITFLDLPDEKLISNTDYQLAGNITFKDLSFAYETQIVLERINFTIKKGEKIAIVGPTGSGKSTIVKLLLKFYEPNAGTIFVDNIPLTNINPHNLRAKIAYIPQDFFLLSSSIKDNITFYQKVNSRTYEQALKLITVADTTQYNSENNQLSAGEKQLITIARAYIKNASILILDEATSHLDSYTEQVVTNALNELMQHKTSIIIAHRLETIKKCDRIIVLKDGHIVEVGSFEELINNHSTFYHLYY